MNHINNQIFMQKTIKVGFLFPYSSIHPNMSKDIIDGIQAALPDSYKSRFQFYPEYIYQGNSEQVKMAVNKLVNFDQVDVVSGVINYKLIPEITHGLGNKNKIGFFFDLGEYLPPLEPTSPNIFFNSFQMWQLQFSLGQWAQAKFGRKGAILMSLYDSGYHLHSSFWQGAIASGAEEIDMHTLPFSDANYSLPDLLNDYLYKIDKSDVSYLHPIFCGNEASQFFDVYKKSTLYNKLPLIISPHMASEDILEQVKNLSIKCYSTSGWNYEGIEDVNIEFKRNYEAQSGRKSSIFALLGYEVGRAFENSIDLFERNDFNALLEYFTNVFVKSARGVRTFNMFQQHLSPNINIEKISTSNLNVTKTIVAQGQAMNFDHAVFSDIHNNSISGWKNPYLCI